MFVIPLLQPRHLDQSHEFSQSRWMPSSKLGLQLWLVTQAIILPSNLRSLLTYVLCYYCNYECNERRWQEGRLQLLSTSCTIHPQPLSEEKILNNNTSLFPKWLWPDLLKRSLLSISTSYLMGVCSPLQHQCIYTSDVWLKSFFLGQVESKVK